MNREQRRAQARNERKTRQERSRLTFESGISKLAEPQTPWALEQPDDIEVSPCR